VINLVTSGHQKWDGKSMIFRPTFKSETDFTVPAVYAPCPLMGVKIKCNRASGASEKIFEKITGKQCKYRPMCLSNLAFSPLNFSSPPIFTKICPSFFQGRRLRPCFNGVDAPDIWSELLIQWAGVLAFGENCSEICRATHILSSATKM